MAHLNICLSEVHAAHQQPKVLQPHIAVANAAADPTKID